ncbi:MAG TPA: LCP family protein [Bellilinea sp.]|nr:LCP family protein [Bellilinea sp.]
MRVKRSIIRGYVAVLVLLSTALSACQSNAPIHNTTTAQPPTLTVTPSPTSTATLTSTPLLRPTRVDYPTPQIVSTLPVLAPNNEVEVPASVRTLLLLGTDSLSPFPGRTDAVMLVLYNPPNPRASFLSVPPDTVMFIPGWTTQRINTAYALGGNVTVRDAIQYNLGVPVDDVLLIHLNDFVYFVDDLPGVMVQVEEEMPYICRDLPQGNLLLNGDQAMCYLRFRQDMDEPSRNDRQQKVLAALMQRLSSGGNLVRLPFLYASHYSSIETTLSLPKIVQAIPLFLRMGERGNFRFDKLRYPAVDIWPMQDAMKTKAFVLTLKEAIPQVQVAVDYVLTPASEGENYPTLVYAMTVSPSPTITPTSTVTLTPTVTSTYTPTFTRTVTPSPTITGTRTMTPTGTLTLTPFTETPTETATP